MECRQSDSADIDAAAAAAAAAAAVAKRPASLHASVSSGDVI